MAASHVAHPPVTTLRAAWARGRRLHRALDAATGSSGDAAYQSQLREAIEAFTAAAATVERAGVFSSNETAEDIATGDLLYLLVGAFLGELHGRVVDRDTPRLHALRTADAFFRGFLLTLDRHGLLTPDDRAAFEQMETPTRRDPARQRERKIALFRREKDAKAQLQALEARLRTARGVRQAEQAEDDDLDDERAWEGVDEEARREHTLALIESFTLLALNQLELIQQETQMLEMVARDGPPAPAPAPAPSQRFKPIVIKDTRSILQRQVFQPGWRQPTMTLDEFLDLERARGNILEGGGPAQEERQRREAEERALRDDDDAADVDTYKARRWDEYTDDHKRGAGNTYNRS